MLAASKHWDGMGVGGRWETVWGPERGLDVRTEGRTLQSSPGAPPCIPWEQPSS